MAHGDERGDREDEAAAGDADPPEVVELPITDTLDLHSFPPAQVADVVRDYLDAAWEKGLYELRVVHGRGIGVQREIVRKVLERDPRVRAFSDAPAEAGGWGATLVTLGEAPGAPGLSQRPARS
jgi:dsDNA-specific endonuclease/ATPase MutS2